MRVRVFSLTISTLQQIASSLKSMAEFEGSEEEFKETFMSNFQVSFSDLFGSVHTQNLKEGGDEIAVTKDTCQVDEQHVAVTEPIVHVIHIVCCFQVCGRLLSSITHLSCINLPSFLCCLQEYVDLYTEWLLNESISMSFNAFKRGFDLVMSHTFLADLFTAEEVEMLICGCHVSYSNPPFPKCYTNPQVSHTISVDYM